MNRDLRKILDELKPEGVSDALAIKKLKALQRELAQDIRDRDKRREYLEDVYEKWGSAEASSEAGLRGEVIRLAHANPKLRPHLLPLLREAAGGWKELSLGGKKYRWRKNDLFKKNPNTQAALDIEWERPRGLGWGEVKNLDSRSKVFEKAIGKKPGKTAAKPDSPEFQAKMYAKGYRYMIQWSPKSKMKNKDPLYVKSPDQAAKLVREDFPDEKDWKAVPIKAPKKARSKRAYFTLLVEPGLTEWQHPTKTLTRGAFKTEREALGWAQKNIPGEGFKVKWIDDPKEIVRTMLEVTRAVHKAGEQGVRVDSLPALGVREMLSEGVVMAERGYLYPREPKWSRFVKSLRGVRLG